MATPNGDQKDEDHHSQPHPHTFLPNIWVSRPEDAAQQASNLYSSMRAAPLAFAPAGPGRYYAPPPGPPPGRVPPTGFVPPTAASSDAVSASHGFSEITWTDAASSSAGRTIGQNAFRAPETTQYQPPAWSTSQGPAPGWGYQAQIPEGAPMFVPGNAPAPPDPLLAWSPSALGLDGTLLAHHLHGAGDSGSLVHQYHRGRAGRVTQQPFPQPVGSERLLDPSPRAHAYTRRDSRASDASATQSEASGTSVAESGQRLDAGTDGRRFACPLPGCSKRYTTKRNLDGHVAAKHTHEFQFTCGICGQGFYRAQDGKRHERAHDTSKHPQCQNCGKTLSRQDALKKHQRKCLGLLRME